MRCRQQPLYSAIGRLPGDTTLWLQARVRCQRLCLSLVVRHPERMRSLKIALVVSAVLYFAGVGMLALMRSMDWVQGLSTAEMF